MKNFSITLILLLISSVTFAQKDNGKVEFDKKTDNVTDASGNILFKMVGKRNANTTFMEYSVQNKDGKELFFISCTEFNDPQERSSSDPAGRTIYFIFNFLDLNQTAESRIFVSKNKLAQYIADSRLIKDGALDPDGVKRFVQLTGTKFSERKKVLDQPNQTIIINNNNPPANKGINININPH